MARKRKRPDVTEPALSMTPMIDVVFQLLIYFIVTTKPIDVMTNLDVFRPAPDKTAKEDQKPPNLVRVGVYQDGYTVNDIPVTLDKLDAALGKVASIDTGQTIMITVSAVSKHGMLVKVLDLCAKNNLRSLSVVSASN
ncbi:MAG TPA: biopolymer transporter ExbD [Kiritimatiellia bacterium]|jgi:biopolymer transport protein ExbD|nr:biopolymer transporter ExbD [Kiritimatiellia bacterium]OQC60584.1 MAG: biopolymer transport protein ExbD [Verrucomicrobia bacterium ADurb.Bin018]MBP9572013.1 biopolymer transporter ExbD [Kiritimatiellia bacterium]HOE00112.1 biopolymer transporter ExbD [Kiritimatiellia bacterium]HOE36425.1 biopolymer transporter ExbD [Kiritimatiellia bacterium]